MSVEQFLKCSECGALTPYKDAKYTAGRFAINHKPDCSQTDTATPRLYIGLRGS